MASNKINELPACNWLINTASRMRITKKFVVLELSNINSNKMPMCIVCGNSESEVIKLFCFPKRPERSNVWLESMGLAHQGRISTFYKICNNHFTGESFVPKSNSMRLKRDAVPTIRASSQTETRNDGNVVEQEMLQQCCPIQEPNAQNIERRISPTRLESCEISMTDEPNLNVASKQGTSQQECLIQEPNTSYIEMSTSSITLESCECASTTGQIINKDVCQANKEAIMKRTLQNKIKQLKKLQKKCRKRRNTITTLLGGSSMELKIKDILSHVTPTSATFIAGQIRCGKVSPHGRRWTTDEKVLALTILKRSPRAYELLRKFTALPSKNTLNRLLQKIPFEAGINHHILKHLSQCLQKLDEQERYCSLAFDEMAIREHIEYNRSKNCIDGLEDFGRGRRTEHVARFAIVFLAQGIAGNWKQPIAYYLTRNGVSANNLQEMLSEVLHAMSEMNIPVIATVCDMGTSNVRALQNMGSNPDSPCIVVDNKEIFTIYDVPHLLKCTRNLMRKHNVLLPCVTLNGSQQLLEARWTDIVDTYEEDKKNPLIFRLLQKVKDEYLAPQGGRVMKVKVAAQIMSQSVACAIFSMVKSGMLPSRAIATATFVHYVDQMFDSLNSTSKTPLEHKPYRCMVSVNSGHIQFWDECREKVSNWRYIRSTKDVGNPNTWKPPSQRGWLYTLEAMKQLTRKLGAIGITSFKPRTLNQDALENLFGGIRSACGCNENPTVSQFVSALKTQIVNRLSGQNFTNTNCEEDSFELLTDLRCFLEVEGDGQGIGEEYSTTRNYAPELCMHVESPNLEKVVNYISSGSFQSQSVAYVAGFIINHIFKDWDCDACSADLRSDKLQPCNTFIALKDADGKNQEFCYPSERFVAFLGHAITQLESELPTLRREENLELRAIAKLEPVLNFNVLTCAIHKKTLKDQLLRSICQIGFKWYCTRSVRAFKNKSTNKRKKAKILHM